MNRESKGAGTLVGGALGCLALLLGSFLLRAILGLFGMTVEAVWPGYEGLVCAGLFLAAIVFMVGALFYVIIAAIGGPRQIWPFFKWLLRGRRGGDHPNHRPSGAGDRQAHRRDEGRKAP